MSDMDRSRSFAFFSPVIPTQEAGAEGASSPTSLEHAVVLHVAHDRSSVQVVGKDRRITPAKDARDEGGVEIPPRRRHRRHPDRGERGGVLWTIRRGEAGRRNCPRILGLVLAAVGLLFLFVLDAASSRAPGPRHRHRTTAYNSKIQMASVLRLLIVGRRWNPGRMRASTSSAGSASGATSSCPLRVQAARASPAPRPSPRVGSMPWSISGPARGGQGRPGGRVGMRPDRQIEGVAGGTRPRFPYDLLHDDEGRVDLGDFRAPWSPCSRWS